MSWSLSKDRLQRVTIPAQIIIAVEPDFTVVSASQPFKLRSFNLSAGVGQFATTTPRKWALARSSSGNLGDADIIAPENVSKKDPAGLAFNGRATWNGGDYGQQTRIAFYKFATWPGLGHRKEWSRRDAPIFSGLQSCFLMHLDETSMLQNFSEPFKWTVTFEIEVTRRSFNRTTI